MHLKCKLISSHFCQAAKTNNQNNDGLHYVHATWSNHQNQWGLTRIRQRLRRKTEIIKPFSHTGCINQKDMGWSITCGQKLGKLMLLVLANLFSITHVGFPCAIHKQFKLCLWNKSSVKKKQTKTKRYSKPWELRTYSSKTQRNRRYLTMKIKRTFPHVIWTEIWTIQTIFEL